MKILEILIPTYKRPAAASRAIQSVLDINDSRLSVRCNSNGYEATLESYRSLDSRVIYDCFNANKGALANFLYLINSSDAKYCMLLSDEDYIESVNIVTLLDFLEKMEGDITAIGCSVFDSERNEYSFLPRDIMKDRVLNYNDFLVHGLVTSYMSGIIYSTCALRNIDITHLQSYGERNAYSHIEIMRLLLTVGNFKYFLPRVVIKGEEIKFGGDGYSHLVEVEKSNKSKNLNLNPNLYGPYARTRQFFFIENTFQQSPVNIKSLARLLGCLRTYLFFIGSILTVDSVVKINNLSDIRKECNRGVADSKTDGDYSGSFFSLLFSLSVVAPRIIIIPLVSLTSFLCKAGRFFYLYLRFKNVLRNEN